MHGLERPEKMMVWHGLARYQLVILSEQVDAGTSRLPELQEGSL
jgi:hypothetical protein